LSPSRAICWGGRAVLATAAVTYGGASAAAAGIATPAMPRTSTKGTSACERCNMTFLSLSPRRIDTDTFFWRRRQVETLLAGRAIHRAIERGDAIAKIHDLIMTRVGLAGDPRPCQHL